MKTKSLVIFSAALFTSAFAAAVQLQAQQASLGAPLAKEAVLSSLTSKVDTKKSKVGDTVTAKTLNPLQLTDGTTLPPGTKLVGKVTQVQPKSSGTATLAIVFTEVDKKGGAPMPVHGLLAAVAPEPSMSDSGGSTNDFPWAWRKQGADRRDDRDRDQCRQRGITLDPAWQQRERGDA